MRCTINILYLICLICSLYLTNINCFVPVHPTTKFDAIRKNSTGKQLILTPLINHGKIKEARTAAEVHFDEFKGIKSYAGYLTVNENYNSNLFFWFFPSQNKYDNAPVILWLQGGPGCSSLFGLFVENGPFEFIPEQNCSLSFREKSWSTNHSVLYIDNPVGTGYSSTNEDGYARNETIIGQQLYRALLQFFQLFPELQKNDFFVAGESYGGKYVPAVSYAIHKNNPTAKQKINLQGLAIGNGWSDPEHQLAYGDYLYQLGLVDSNIKSDMNVIAKRVVEHIHQQQWIPAYNVSNQITDIMFPKITGCDNYYNYLSPNDETNEATECYVKYVRREDVAAAIHVGNVYFEDCNDTVQNYLDEDEEQSVAVWISKLLSHYRTVFYNGQLDVIVAYPLTVNFLKNLNFSASDEYKTATRQKWYVGEELAGYFKEAGNLTEVLVLNAGHMVPFDQPSRALDLISKFTRNEKL